MRAILLSAVLLLAGLAARAQPDLLSTALAAVEAGDFELAAEATGQMDDPVARDLVTWARLRAENGRFEEYVAFLERRADWPGLPLLRVRGEGSIPEGADPNTVVAYFEPRAPRTGTGALRLAAALEALGRGDEARTEIARAWRELPLTEEETATFLDRYGPILAEHDIARLDNLLWLNESARAREMFPRVPEGWQLLAEARLALRARATGVDALIEAVPEALRGDPGLAYERFVWRMRAGLWPSAGDLILAASADPEGLGRPAEWANRRRSLARDVIRAGEFGRAYRIASTHGLDPETGGFNYADLEWIAGYAALRMGDAAAAVRHFSNFRAVVFTPISLGRAGYWLGRAHEAAGDADAAAEAYALGAEFQSSFYGQMAAERAGIAPDPAFLADEAFGDWREAPFILSPLFHAALLLYEAGEIPLAGWYLAQLTGTLDRSDAGRLAAFALDLGSPHLALMVAKRAAQDGHEIMRGYYPLADLAFDELPAPPALILSIARRESEFRADVISSAGALGLMQVMPATGRAQAERMEVEFSRDRMLADPAFNARIGAGYLAYVAEDLGTNPVLLAAAYNAGPNRARQWIERFGDPRDPEVDIVDWIESVPFRETRNYIMRVTEGLAIYEAQLTGRLPERGLSERLRQR